MRILAILFLFVSMPSTGEQDRNFFDTILKVELSFSEKILQNLNTWYKKQKLGKTSTIAILNDQNSLLEVTLLTSLKTKKSLEETCASLKNDDRWVSVIEKQLQKTQGNSSINQFLQTQIKNYHTLFNKPQRIQPRWDIDHLKKEIKDPVRSSAHIQFHLPIEYTMDGFYWNKSSNKPRPSKIKEELYSINGQMTFEYTTSTAKICLETNQIKIKANVSMHYQTRRNQKIITTKTPKKNIHLFAVSIPSHYQNLLEEAEHLKRVQHLCQMSKSKIEKENYVGTTLLDGYLKTKCSIESTKLQRSKNLCPQTHALIKLKDCLHSKSEY